MNREKLCHLKNGTFGEEWPGPGPCPKPVPAGWVFKIKHRGAPIEEQDLLPKQFKARVVIRGQFMKEGLDFNDTFAPVAKPMTLRSVLAVATRMDTSSRLAISKLRFSVLTWIAKFGSRGLWHRQTHQ